MTNLLLYLLPLLSIETVESTAGAPVELSNSSSDVYGVVAASVTGGTPEGGVASVRVVWETSTNGEDWLPAGYVTFTGTGRHYQDLHLPRLYMLVRARVEVRGDILVNVQADLASQGRLVKPKDGKKTQVAPLDEDINGNKR